MFSQWLINNICKKKNGSLLIRIYNHALLLIRKIILKFNSSVLIKYRLENVDITLPFRHDLPIIRRTYAYYDSAIGRIPKYLTQKYSNFQAIDIGANVGDTAIVIKAQLDIPILCIEADNFYYQLLLLNTKNINRLSYEQCFVGDLNENKLKLVSYKGTARLVETNLSGDPIHFKTLLEIMENHKEFNNVKYLKIDTDGYDCKIIRSNLDYLKINRPVIFFEYDPYFLDQLDDDGLSVFNSLKEIGYQKLLIYDNTGVYLISLEIENKKALEELNTYFSGWQSEKYLDICAFHQNDNGIAEIVREEELKFAIKQKSNSFL
jgi:FkbM family methyltransferase